MSTGRETYKFGQKNNWRRRTWNMLAREVPDPRTAVGLFLAAPECLDVPVALSKGFKAHNLFAVESDKKAAKKIAKSGVNVVRGDLGYVLGMWPAHTPFDFVLADLTTNFSDDVMRLMFSLMSSIGMSRSGCVVVLNLLRGRETGVRERCLLGAIARGVTRGVALSGGGKFRSAKHRGFALKVWLTGILSGMLAEQVKADSSSHWSRASPDDLCRYLSYDSYKSSTQTFDSVVLSLDPALCVGLQRASLRLYKQKSCDSGERSADRSHKKLCVSAKSHISATLAYRTRRMA